MADMAAEDLSAFTMISNQRYLESTPTISLADADLSTNASQSPEPSQDCGSQDSGSPPPEGECDESGKKPTKKRKSWGQELPTPKTNLPPRKRAKTDDEKEQRRIERVLRNRAAAQSSRERKRQEVEKLEGEKTAIEQENLALRERVLTVENEKWRLQQRINDLITRLGQGTPNEPLTAPVQPEHDLFPVKTEPNTGLPSPGPSRQGSTGYRSRSASLQSQGMAPPQHATTKPQSARHVPAPLDLSRHPAEMMSSFDLQCAGLKTDGLALEAASKETTGHATTGAITINVNGELVDTINDADMMSLSTLAMPCDQEQGMVSSTFDALISDMSPNAPTNSDFTPSPEAPSLSFLEDCFSAGSPCDGVTTPDFNAFDIGSCDFDFSLDTSYSKSGDKTTATEPLMFTSQMDFDLNPFATT